ncbi:MAG: spore coat protein CotJB [Defluviitaleaceae bacterium]|nr:spore coat protein CotJB [Defluviitaleaceae bacterium]
MNKYDIEKELYTLDFLALDLHLYLNTHPNDREALAEYNKVAALAAQARKKYEEHFGPLHSFRCPAGEHEWNWLSEYSPWEKEFNWSFDDGGEN